MLAINPSYMLQRAIILVGLFGGIALLGYVLNVTNKTEYTASTATTTVATSTEPQYPEEWLEEAEAAKQAVIDKKKLEKRQRELNSEIDALQGELDKVEKELGVY